MNGETEKNDLPDEDGEDFEGTDTSNQEATADAVDEDNVGDISVEINVEELVAKLESTNPDDKVRKREIRRRLDELSEQREAEQNIDSTYNFNLDEDL